ncbi:hypothetical protein CEXT_503731 [Caerostris extrusa]|uniref:Uncharacterized protein n=1 Tax=Caerostris extrusa TaxID=172846 RepID=A0AAV4WK53_CAEEX|nr:hypothetical protein CEXT_503731 [Caerostris extrusa]
MPLNFSVLKNAFHNSTSTVRKLFPPHLSSAAFRWLQFSNQWRDFKAATANCRTEIGDEQSPLLGAQRIRPSYPPGEAMLGSWSKLLWAFGPSGHSLSGGKT